MQLERGAEGGDVVTHSTPAKKQTALRARRAHRWSIVGAIVTALAAALATGWFR